MVESPIYDTGPQGRRAKRRFTGGVVRLVVGLSAASVALSGCAHAPAPATQRQPLDGIAEYGDLVTYSQNAVAAALRALEQVSAETNACSSEVIDSFGKVVERLHVESLRVRARSRAMLARGDDYFARWQETIAGVKDSQVRQLAQDRRPLLERSFGTVKVTTHRAADAFKSFLSGLAQLQLQVEKDPAYFGSAPAVNLVQAVRSDGQEVQLRLGIINQELIKMKQLLTPGELPGSDQAYESAR